MRTKKLNMTERNNLLIRRMMTDIHGNFYRCLRRGNIKSAYQYSGMASALIKACCPLMNEPELSEQCELLFQVLESHLDFYENNTLFGTYKVGV